MKRWTDSDRTRLLAACSIAIAVMFVAKVVAVLLGVDLPWGTAVTVGGVLGSFFYLAKSGRETNAETSSSIGSTDESNSQILVSSEKLKQVMFWFEATTWAMYPLLFVCAYETSQSGNYVIGSIWIIAGLLYFYSYHLLRDLLKK